MKLSTILLKFFILNLFVLSAEEPLEFYKQASREKDTFLRGQGFNKTIETLLDEKQDSIEKDLLLGKSLVQLRQYPLALYYYLKALKKDPENPEIKTLADEAVRVGNLPASIDEGMFKRPSRVLMGALLLASCFLIALRKKVFLLASLPLIGWFLYLLFLDYRSPILAVVLHASILSKEPTKNEPVNPAPIPAGLVVTVLDVVDSGAWVKVRSSSGIMGYLPEHSLRLID